MSLLYEFRHQSEEARRIQNASMKILCVMRLLGFSFSDLKMAMNALKMNKFNVILKFADSKLLSNMIRNRPSTELSLTNQLKKNLVKLYQ